MPHAVFDLSARSVTADIDISARQLIPGIAPGGSRVGQPTKPALLIRDAWLELNDWTSSLGVNFHQMRYYLKLSQERDLDPGLLLPVGSVRENIVDAGIGNTDQPVTGATVRIDPEFRAQGTMWAPLWVGVRTVETGTASLDCDVHLDYERVDIPWMDWFLMWDFLDNIVDNETEY